MLCRFLHTLQASNQFRDCIVEYVGGSKNIHLITSEQLRGVFDLLDADGDGALTLAELEASEIGLMCTDAELKGLIRYMCHDQSEVRFAEFCAWWKEARSLLAIQHCMSSTELKSALDEVEGTGVVFIGGKSCPSCKKMEAPFLQIALDYTDSSLLHMDMDSNRSTWKFCKEHAIKHVPTFLFYRRGNLVQALNTTDQKTLEIHMKRLHEPECASGSGQVQAAVKAEEINLSKK